MKGHGHYTFVVTHGRRVGHGVGRRVGYWGGRGNRLARCDIPQANGVVVARARQSLTIWVKGHAHHPIRMPYTFTAQFTRCHRPDAHGLIIAATGQQCTIWAEGHFTHPPGVFA